MVIQFGRIELYEHLAFFYPVVYIHKHTQDRARKLAADIDRTGWLQRAICRNSQREVTPANGFGYKNGGCVAPATRQPEIGANSGNN